jgi:hypothetical protein
MTLHAISTNFLRLAEDVGWDSIQCCLLWYPYRTHYVRDDSMYSTVMRLHYVFCSRQARIHKNFLGEWAHLPAHSDRIQWMPDGMVVIRGPVWIVPRIYLGVFGRVVITWFSFAMTLLAGMRFINYIIPEPAMDNDSAKEIPKPNKKNSAIQEVIQGAFQVVSVVGAGFVAWKTWHRLEWWFPTVVGIHLR